MNPTIQAAIISGIAVIIAAIIAFLSLQKSKKREHKIQQELEKQQNQHQKELEKLKQNWQEKLQVEKHKFEKERDRYAEEVKLLQKITFEKIDALKKITYHQAEFEHCVEHLLKGDQQYEKELKKWYKSLRSLARKHQHLLGPYFEKSVYEFTGEGNKILIPEEFDKKAYSHFKSELDKMKKSIEEQPYFTITREKSEMKFKLSLKQIANLLRVQEFVKFNNPRKWHSILDEYRPELLVGEIRKAEDWNCLPLGKNLRATYLEDAKGPVIRWSDSEGLFKKTGDFLTHDELATFKPGNSEVARTGWINVTRNREIIVK